MSKAAEISAGEQADLPPICEFCGFEILDDRDQSCMALDEGVCAP